MLTEPPFLVDPTCRFIADPTHVCRSEDLERLRSGETCWWETVRRRRSERS